MTSPARIMSGDLFEATFEIEFEGQKFKARRLPDRIDFAEAGSTEPFGSIKFATPTSGAIWIGPELIGEFEMIDDKFTVTPIVRGQMLPDDVERMDPVRFLLTSYAKGASE